VDAGAFDPEGRMTERPKRPGGRGRALPHPTPDNPLDQNLLHLLSKDTGSEGPRIIQRRFIDYEPYYNGGFAGAVTIDWSLSPVQYATLTDDAVITHDEMEDGGTYVLFIKQDATGGHAANWPNTLWPNDDPVTEGESEGELILPIYANAMSIVTFVAGRLSGHSSGDLMAFGVGQTSFG
jgi:hypothetical protein